MSSPAAETTEATRGLSLYDMIGGAPKVHAIVDRFYEIMDQDQRAAGIRAMHAPVLSPVRERLFEFLSGWLGGPPLFFQRPDHKCIMSAHRPFRIGGSERDQWMLCMRQALVDCQIADNVRTLLDQPFLRMCEVFRSR